MMMVIRIMIMMMIIIISKSNSSIFAGIIYSSKYSFYLPGV